MGSSEDYLDSLLKSMGVPAELASPTKKDTDTEKSAPAEESSREPVSKPSSSSGESALDDLLKQMSEPAPAIVEPQVEETATEDISVNVAEELEVSAQEPVFEEPLPEETSSESLSDDLDIDNLLSDVSSLTEESSAAVEDSIDHSADIPDLTQIMNEDPAASDVHIDSAPSLDVPDDDSAMDADLSDLMSDLMSKIESEDSQSEAIDETAIEESSSDAAEPELSLEDLNLEDLGLSDDTSELEEAAALEEALAVNDIAAIEDAPSSEEASDELNLEDLNLDDLGISDDTVAVDEAAELEEALAVNEISALEDLPSAEEASGSENPTETPSEENNTDESSSEDHLDIDDSFSDLLSEAESVLNGISEDSAVGDLPVEEASEESSDVPSEEDLDAQLAALLEESGVDTESSESAESEGLSDGASDDFDLDAELAELMKEENESEGSLSEDEIESMLNKAREEGLAEDPDRSDMSLDDLLAADSGSAGEIGDLLDKSDNNEAVDPGIEALINGSDEADAPDVLGETAEEAPVDKAAEKKRLKEEKKEARRKAKEEKARLRKEAKEAKKAKKKSNGVSEENVVSSDNAENADMSDVDALLAGAAEAAAEVKAAALTSEASAAPIEIPAENDELNEADSLLAEIMGNPLSEEDLYDSLSEGNDKTDEVPSDEPVSLPADELDDLLEKEAKEKKPKKGLIAKIIDLLTETDEDEEGEASEIKLSEENAEVLEQLEAEDGDGKKGKKKKKKKDKGKKSDDAGSDEEGGDGEVGGKKEKKKKPKKEKKPKNEEPEKPGKKLNKKKVIAIFALCATILVAVLIISKLLGAHAVKEEAREAYAEGDYQTAYQDLFGLELNESDTIIFKRSECILKIRLWYREYEYYRDESDVRALDSLIQSVFNYPDLYASAVKWQCLEEVEPVYAQIVDALYANFGLTEEEAIEIAMIKKDVDYTRAVYDVVNGNHGQPQDAESQPEEILETPAVPEDLIPGEDDPGEDIIFVNP